MKNALRVFLLVALLLPAASFDAASIKPSEANPTFTGVDTDNGLLRIRNLTLRRCIMAAYGVPDSQIAGTPKSMDDLRYDIVARAEGRPTEQQLMEMLQTLLAERFKLALHHETQMMPGYAMTVAKGGIKAIPSEPNAASSTDTNRSGGVIQAKACPMWRLVLKLSAIVRAPVVDMTEDTRHFDFILRWTPDEMAAKAAASSETTALPSFFTAVQEQLGLKLDARKVPIDVLVIDHAELPSEN